MYLGGYLAVNLAATVLVVCLVSTPWAGLRLVFEAWPLVWMGRVSYGLYLWHIALFWILGPTVLAIAVTGAVAAASYLLLERPILRFKHRFDRSSSGRAPA